MGIPGFGHFLGYPDYRGFWEYLDLVTFWGTLIVGGGGGGGGYRRGGFREYLDLDTFWNTLSVVDSETDLALFLACSGKCTKRFAQYPAFSHFFARFFANFR